MASIDDLSTYSFLPDGTDEEELAINQRSNGDYGLTWSDSFYDDTADVIAVFDLDYEKIIRRLVILQWTTAIALTVNPIIMLIFMFVDGPRSTPLYFASCFLVAILCYVVELVVRSMELRKLNITGTHVAVTRRGLRKDTHAYPTGAHFRKTIVVSRYCC